MKKKIALLILLVSLLTVIGPRLLVGAASLKVIAPNGGEILHPGGKADIRWQSADIEGKIVVILYKNGIKHTVLSQETDNTGVFLWEIPGDFAEGTDYRIRVRALSNLSINDFSDRDFSIKK